MTRIIAPAILAALLAACGSGANSLDVTAADFGDAWPLTTPAARLYCTAAGERYMAVDGVTYALNGQALSTGMQRPDAVLRADMSAGVLSERAAALCV